MPNRILPVIVKEFGGGEASNNVEVIQEGNETDGFWTLLGGKKPYADNPEFEQHDIKARLFQCSDATGIFKVDEIMNFCQDDLINDDVMILDAYHEVFVWIGDKSTEK